MAEKSYRIRTNIQGDNVVKTVLSQDIEFLEILSLKINQQDTYKLHVSNYGIIVGRVLANDAFGIPNAKVSVFIKLNETDIDRSEIVNLYPYKTFTTKDKNNKRYNLLSDSSNDSCHRIVGTFPNKRLVLDNDTEIEIYEKYWKFTTVTNQSGDFMIFGVPTGNQTLHVDIDLSDIGILSQKPRDFFYKGYNQEQFDNAEQFKKGNDLENLTQILSQDTSVYVYPFFGDSSVDEIAITRCDVQIPYKFEPTCVFFGSVISDKPGEHIGHNCGPSRWVGYNGRMVTGEGTIEMIRKTPDGLVEEFPIKGNRLIDGDGVWCYQIPMNLDYIGTDEFGNIIPVEDSTKGIPTRTSVRFRISMQETKTEASTEHIAKYLVPNIHELDPNSNKPKILSGNKYNLCYEFGSATPQEYFRDLLWNKVYSVKNYIPRIENGGGGSMFNSGGKSYSGVRSVNTPYPSHSNNVFPFNSARFHLRFNYRLLCILMMVIITIISFYNKLVTEIICWQLSISFKVSRWRVRLNFGRPLKWLSSFIKCIGLKGSMFFEERANMYYFPKCDKSCGSIIESDGLVVNKSKADLEDVIQQTLALEYDLVNFDFHNDWVNGTLYLPLWFWKKRAKKKYLFGLFSRKAVNTFCSCEKQYNNLHLTQGCKTTYNAHFSPVGVDIDGGKKRHREFDIRQVQYGVIKEFTNKDDLKVYYYAPGVPNNLDYQNRVGLTDYTQLFATDIILLGSLNNCDLDNLPKTFDSLPSSTANIPFIASLTSEETGDGIVTGLDWGHDGGSTSFKYSDGLLMDLTCWDVATRYKSCVNLARLSELYVTMDMDIRANGDGDEDIVHDGLITSEEIVENETRAKFASLNHNGLNNKVKNITTNYDTYKFHYLYPTNFDGHLGDLRKYQRRDENKRLVTDTYDSNYVMYRLGEGKDGRNKIRHKKHFYNGNESQFQFPLYNNSFYFYFGLKEGKTAIDKFNTLFNAACATENKYAFTIEYVSKPGKWCYDIEKIATDFGTIDINFNGLSDIFSYSLYNEFNELLIQEIDVQSPDLRFGYDIAQEGGAYISTNDGYKKDGRLKEFKTGKLVTNVLNEPIYLENGVYFLEVTNQFGLKVTQKINMIQNVLSPNIEIIRLGTKYKSTTKVSDICGEMDYYGEVKINSFIIDGEEAFIKNVEPLFLDGVEHVYDINGTIVAPENGWVVYGNGRYKESEEGVIEIDGISYERKDATSQKEVICQIQCSDGSEVLLKLKHEEEVLNIQDFACYGVGNIPTIQIEKIGTNIYTLILNIWKPGNYVLTSQQLCKNQINDNFSINIIKIENGENFQAFVNGIPMTIVSNNNFHHIPSNATFPQAWLQLENPKIYNFPSTTLKDADFWDDFLPLNISTSGDGENIVEYVSQESKINILAFQVETIAKMRDMAYIMGAEKLPQITITTIGGKEPILIRSIHPNYSLLNEENEYCDEIVVESLNMLDVPLNYPLIIDQSYQKGQRWEEKDSEYCRIRLNNTIYSSHLVDNLGNYFAAFTNNGGLVSLINGLTKFNPSLFVESSPRNASPLHGYGTINPSIISSYPQIIVNESVNQTIKPYFRSLTLDKRLIIYGNLWAPVFCNYEIDGENEDWKNGRWQCSVYNAAPMVYDDDYNIIGKDLSYSFKIVKDETEKEELKFVPNGNPSCEYNEQTNKYILSGTFFANRDLIVQGENEEELLKQIMNVYDNIICNATLIINKTVNNKLSSVTLNYNQLQELTTKEDLEGNKDIKLVSNLMWISNLGAYKNNKHFMRNTARLFKCSINVDGEEKDERDTFVNMMYGSEKNEGNGYYPFVSKLSTHETNGLTIAQGKHLNVELANCRLNGDVSYEILRNENEEEYFSFKSYVESGDIVSEDFDIGERVSINSGSICYSNEKNGKYFVWNNEKIFLQDSKTKEKYYVFKKLPYQFENIDGDYKYYIDVNGTEDTLTQSLNRERTNGPLMECTNGKLGYFWEQRQYLYMSEDNFKKLLQKHTVQEILNRYGIPIYTMPYASIVLIDVKGSVLLKAQIRGLYYTFNPYKFIQDYRAESSYYATVSGYTVTEKGYDATSWDEQYCSKPWEGIGGYKYKLNDENETSGETYDYYYLKVKLGKPNSSSSSIKPQDVCMIFIITADEYNNMTSVFNDKGWQATRGKNHQRLMVGNGHFYPRNGSITASTDSDGDTEYEVSLSSQTIYLPTFVKVFLDENKKPNKYAYEKNELYGVNVGNARGEIYLIPYFYLRIPVNNNKYNENYLISIYDVGQDGSSLTIGENEYVVERNILQNRVYLRPSNSDKTYYMLENIYIKYKNYFPYKNNNDKYEYYCEDNVTHFSNGGEKDINFNYGIEPWDETKESVVVKSFIEDNGLKDKISQAVLTKDTDGSYYCYIMLPHTYEIVQRGKENNIIKLDGDDGQTYEILNSQHMHFFVSHIEDFSCTINKDEYNSTYNHIEANPPFLSSAIIKHYGFNQTYRKSYEIVDGEVYIPNWQLSNSEEDDIIIKEDSTIKNGFVSKNANTLTYKNKIYPTTKEGENYTVDIQINEINAQTLGDRIYQKGNNNVQNIFKENKNANKEYYGNCNMVGSSPWLSDEKDKELDRKYRTQTPIIGETYTYYDKYMVGEFDDKGYFVMDDEKNGGYFYQISKCGRQYGNYIAMNGGYELESDVFQCYNLKGDVKSLKRTHQFTNRMGIQISPPLLYGLNGSLVGEIIENNDLYNNLIYVFQPNKREGIKEGTEIISCNFVKTYFDENLDYRYKIQPIFNQSSNFHVGPIYFGNVFTITNEKNEKKFYLPIILINDFNQDVKNNLLNGNINYYFNGISYDFKNVLYEQDKITNTSVIYYSQFDSLNKKEIGWNRNISDLKNDVNNKYAAVISDLSTTNETYLASYKKVVSDYTFNYEGGVYKPQFRLYQTDEGDKTNSIKMKCKFISMGEIYNINIDNESELEENNRPGLEENNGSELEENNGSENGYLKALLINENEVIHKSGFTARTSNNGEMKELLFEYYYYLFFAGHTIEWEFDEEKNIQEIKPFNFNVKNGETTTINDEEVYVSLLEPETLENYKDGDYVTPFSSIWENDISFRSEKKLLLRPLSPEKLQKIQSGYTENVKLKDFLITTLKEIYSTDESEALIDENNLDHWLDEAFSSEILPKYMFTVKLDKPFYYLGGDNVAYEKVNEKGELVAEDKYGNTYPVQIEMVGPEGEKWNEYYIKVDGHKKYAIDHVYIYDVYRETNPKNCKVEVIDSLTNETIYTQKSFDLTSFSNNCTYSCGLDRKVKFKRKGQNNNNDNNIMASIDRITLNEWIADSNKDNPIYLEDEDASHYLCVYSNSGKTNDELYIDVKCYFRNDKHINLTVPFRGSGIKCYNYYNDIFKPTVTLENLNGLFKNDSLISIPYGIAEIKQKDEIIEIFCDDGYIFIGHFNDEITCIDNNGNKNIFTYEEILVNGLLGLFLYHFTQVDGVYYEFVSKIKDIRSVPIECALELSFNGLNDGDNVVLSIEANKIIHKFPFIFNKNKLTSFY